MTGIQNPGKMDNVAELWRHFKRNEDFSRGLQEGTLGLYTSTHIGHSNCNSIHYPGIYTAP